MTVNNELRLLPWTGPDDKPCYLSADDTTGCLSRLANNAEETQLEWGAELVAHTLEVLAAMDADPEELRLLARDLAGARRDVVRVATSRGHRLHQQTYAADSGRLAHLS
ncbi:hypothetical protein [Streptomyces sp. A1136]|uniref:hypothetical protein n=1 Tax=Streptomyces sp. A1136 TaxID=2563102 RepID=UPI00109EACF7|nr:hypothetical protein [Streptomyces sp. A1136]THA47209.1 hypothetical protein E6R62_31890 [Streptomyces sp. A1136]